MLISFLHQLRPLFGSSSIGLEAAPAISMGNAALTWGRCVQSPGAAGGSWLEAPQPPGLVLLPGWKNPTQNLKKLDNKICLLSQGWGAALGSCQSKGKAVELFTWSRHLWGCRNSVS